MELSDHLIARDKRRDLLACDAIVIDAEIGATATNLLLRYDGRDERFLFPFGLVREERKDAQVVDDRLVTPMEIIGSRVIFGLSVENREFPRLYLRANSGVLTGYRWHG